jgi:hypothetical protein
MKEGVTLKRKLILSTFLCQWATDTLPKTAYMLLLWKKYLLIAPACQTIFGWDQTLLMYCHAGRTNFYLKKKILIMIDLIWVGNNRDCCTFQPQVSLLFYPKCSKPKNLHVTHLNQV